MEGTMKTLETVLICKGYEGKPTDSRLRLAEILSWPASNPSVALRNRTEFGDICREDPIVLKFRARGDLINRMEQSPVYSASFL